jgi:hypothetical protein
VRPQGRTVEEILAVLAAERHGNVTRQLLLAAGVTPAEIKHRLGTGYLLPQFRGVYRVGHRAPSTEATYMAAVLAVGEGSALDGLAAAYVYGLARGRAPEPEVIDGVTTRRCRSLAASDLTTWKGIRIPTVPLTLVALAARLEPYALAWAVHQAGIRHGTRPEHVAEVLARRPGARGRAVLLSVLSGDVSVTASALERKFLSRLRREGLPLPITNRPAGGRYVDCRWPDYKLTVELDSYRFHNSRYAWEEDRKRERQAYARGDQFRRYTYDDVYEKPAAMMRELHSIFRVRPA